MRDAVLPVKLLQLLSVAAKEGCCCATELVRYAKCCSSGCDECQRVSFEVGVYWSLKVTSKVTGASS